MNKAGAKNAANRKEVRMRGGIKLTILFPSPQFKARHFKVRLNNLPDLVNRE